MKMMRRVSRQDELEVLLAHRDNLRQAISLVGQDDPMDKEDQVFLHELKVWLEEIARRISVWRILAEKETSDAEEEREEVQ
jgi:hypothetical protein